MDNLLMYFLEEELNRSLLALENAGAISLTKLRSAYLERNSKIHQLLYAELQSTVKLSPIDLELIDSNFIGILSDGFNRSMNVLEKERMIDRKRFSSEYRGIGSKHYDLVSESLNSLVVPWKECLEKFRNRKYINVEHLVLTKL